MEVKERILVKAHDLFMSYGLRSVSMDDIATQLAISKKTIYQYFADKDELVDAVVNGEINEMQGECMHAFSESKDAVHEIFLTMEQVDEQVKNMNPMLLYDMEKFHFKAYQRFLQYKSKFLYQLVRDNLERGIREELYREDVHVDIISRFRLEAIMIPFNINAFPASKYNLGDVTREIMEHYVYGVVTPKGYKLIQKYKQERTKNLISNAKTK